MPGRPKQTVAAPSIEIPKELGAGACLKFLQEQEEKCRAGIITAENSLRELIARRSKNLRADDGKTADEWDKDIRIAQSYIEIAGDEHGKAADRLLKYEKAVAPEKRGDGERITQAEAENILTNCALHLRLGWEQLIARICQEAPLCQSESEVEEKIRPLMVECLESKFTAAIADGKISTWAANALREGL